MLPKLTTTPASRRAWRVSACLRLGWEVFIRAWRIEGYAFAAYEHGNELAVLWQWEIVALIFQSEVRACSL